jgi:transaldolase
MTKRRAVFLDRDGVLNRPVVRDGHPLPPASLEEMEMLPGVSAACAALRESGFLLIVVTNQPDISRGTQSLARVTEMNQWLKTELALDDVRVCPHDDTDACACRKPLPGLLAEAAAEWRIDLSESFMVGDRWRDIEAGKRAGCRTVFIDYGYREQRPSDQDRDAADLRAAADWILSSTNLNVPTNGADPMSKQLKIKIFADGADLASMLKLASDPLIKGFTTNPTLMRQAGIRDYETFAREVVAHIPDRPISFEVFSDDLAEMEEQALHIAEWGDQVYVKIPITNTRRESTRPVLRALAARGVKMNVTALLTVAQVAATVEALASAPSSCISVFAGRIADTGRDPLPIMTRSLELMRPHPHLELIWASPRELLNIIQADSIGCHIITVTPDLLKKLPTVGKDLDQFSLETVQMFYNDARTAGFTLETSRAGSVK